MSTSEIFNRYSDRYDSWFYRNEEIARSELNLISQMINGVDKPILEIGVGTGFYASKLGVEIGIDPSIRMINKAKLRGVNHVIQAIGESLPFRGESIGSVLIVVTICFVDDPIRVFIESYRVLRRRGYIVVCIVPKDSRWGELYMRKGLEGHLLYSLARFYTKREVIDMLTRSGFRIMDYAGVLSFDPSDRGRFEPPSRDLDNKGFVCFKAIKA